MDARNSKTSTTVVATRIHDIVTEYTKAIVDKIANRYGIPRYELLELVRTLDGGGRSSSAPTTTTIESSTSAPSSTPTSTPSKPLSAYVHFCNEQRPTLKLQKPDLKFGEISKELGRIWREMPRDQKKKYERRQDPAQQNDADVPSYTRERLNAMSMTDIRTLCVNLQLKRTGRKEALIEEILRANTTTPFVGGVMRDDAGDGLVFYDEADIDMVSGGDDMSTSTSSFVLDDAVDGDEEF